MLPRLNALAPVAGRYGEFADALSAAGFAGDIARDAATRLVAGTDNSVYQLLPQLVIYPKVASDVALAVSLAKRSFAELTFTARGGGTGTNAQSLNVGVIVDVSRYLNRIVSVDLDAMEAVVEPGVVLDQLNDHLKPHGVFFAPNLSPSSRATVGGMIATDASGKGSRVYGKTSEHVLSLDVVLADGSAATLGPSLDTDAASPDDTIARIAREVAAVLDEAGPAIATEWPKLRRFLTGYDLVHAREPDGALNLARLVTGSEGTLGLVTAARVRLTKIPTVRRLVVLKYGRFEDALASAAEIVKSDPGAIETIDETVLELARDDIIFDAVGPYLVDAPDAVPTRTVNLVEFEGDDVGQVDAQVAALVADVERRQGAEGGPTGIVVAPDETARIALWSLRKKGVGLLGKKPGRRKPVAFVEDTVVPPENLPAYVAEFRAILDAEGVFYGMFGHIDVGCLHVRPALDLTDPEDEARLQRISDKVHAAVLRHGGVIWGEHGKGVRAQYSPEIFGPRLYAAVRDIKLAFDPDNRLNPGKVAVPTGSDAELMSIASPTRGARDRAIPVAVRDAFHEAMVCNGNGACYDYHPDHVMCPSSKITRDRVHSPKGRAGVMREWLRQLTASGYDPLVRAPWGRAKSWLTSPVRLWHTLAKRFGRYDYSTEVYAAMEGCLSCKACATHCPVKVDVPAFRSDFIDIYHRRYLRSPRDHFVAALEPMLPWLARAPRVTNWMLRRGVVKWLTRAVGRLVDTPPVATRSLKTVLADVGAEVGLDGLHALAPADQRQAVVILQDAFTSFYEPQVVASAVEVLRAFGRPVFVAPFFVNGKGLHVKGFRRRFEALAAKNARTLRAIAETGADIVGIEPAVVLTYRDEYPRALGPEAVPPVAMLHEWLAAHASEAPTLGPSGQQAQLFPHCTERTAFASSDRQWREAFEALGLDCRVAAAGCCGMSGAFGHEVAHVDESKGIFELSWAPKLGPAAARGPVVMSGYSCRSQAKRFADVHARHPIEVLAAQVRGDGVVAVAGEAPRLPAPQDEAQQAAEVDSSGGA